MKRLGNSRTDFVEICNDAPPGRNQVLSTNASNEAHASWVKITRDHVDPQEFLDLRGFVFGYGEDGVADFDGTSTVLGLSPSSSTYTLTSDISCLTMRVRSGVTVKTNCHRIFVRRDLILYGTAVIHCDGGAGGDSTGRTTGGAKADPQGDSGLSTLGLGASGGNGGNGGAAPNGAGSNGTAGSDVTLGLGGAGGAGSNGQTVVGGGGNGGAGGSVTNTSRVRVRNVFTAGNLLNGSTLIGGGAGGGGGGGAGADNASNGARGGGGGAGGGVVMISCATLDLTTGSWTGRISANGGNGGNGAVGGLWTGGGGGSGGGGFVLIVAGRILGHVIVSPSSARTQGTQVANANIMAHHGSAGGTSPYAGQNGYNGEAIVLDLSTQQFVSRAEAAAAAKMSSSDPHLYEDDESDPNL